MRSCPCYQRSKHFFVWVRLERGPRAAAGDWSTSAGRVVRASVDALPFSSSPGKRPSLEPRYLLTYYHTSQPLEPPSTSGPRPHLSRWLRKQTTRTDSSSPSSAMRSARPAVPCVYLWTSDVCIIGLSNWPPSRRYRRELGREPSAQCHRVSNILLARYYRG